MPCSGPKSAVSFTPGALRKTSTVDPSSRLTPDGFVINPTRLPCSVLKPSLARTSFPSLTSAAKEAETSRRDSKAIFTQPQLNRHKPQIQNFDGHGHVRTCHVT